MSQIYNPPPPNITTGSGLNYIGKALKVSVAYPAVSLGTKAVSVTVTGVKAADFVAASVNPTSALVVGLAIGGVRVTADNTVEVTFVTPIAVGISAGSVLLDFVFLGIR
ncbi:hypothetical protein [Robbsia andropogonis]|uniref:hypothetical protein n=1 Tax=Robbsia andropogonis TaxID=28092 RepID=UPI000464BEA8|nr:hypothetical protein [Robbsia andropogonis]